MTKCLHCNTDTKNPKFCSRSCSVSFNNKNEGRQHGPKPSEIRPCLNCTTRTRKADRTSFCSRACEFAFYFYSSLERFDEGTTPKDRLKACLIYRHGYKCSICSQAGTHFGKSLTLELDHIDGNSDDNRAENLRLLCPNCHSQTPTYRSKGVTLKEDDRNTYRRKWLRGRSTN